MAGGSTRAFLDVRGFERAVEGAELLYQSGSGDEARSDQGNHCVGIAVDARAGRIYWTQKGPPKGGVGRLFAAGIDLLKGEKPEARSDVVCLMDNLPEPIDLEIDKQRNMLYKTDRGAEPMGNTVSCIDLGVLGDGRGIEQGVMETAIKKRVQEEILTSHLHEAIGLALDERAGKMYFTDLGGSVYSANFDGSDKKEVCKGIPDLTGICVVHVD